MAAEAPGPGGPGRWRRRVPPVLALPAFRRYWLGQWPLLFGKWMQLVGLGYLTFVVTHSAAAVGLVGAVDGLPMLVITLPAGVLADRYPRRRTLMLTTAGMGLTAALLGAAVLSHRDGLPVLLVAALGFGTFDAADAPTRQALVADVVPRHQMLGAAALSSTASSASRILGPTLAGVLLATVGPGPCFLVVAGLALPFLAVLAVGLRDTPVPAAEAGARRHALTEILEGLRWAAADPRSRWILIGMAALGLLGVGYMPYLPVFAREQLHGGGQMLGLCYTMGGIGALLGGLGITAASGRVPRGRLLLMAAPVYAAALFGLTRSHAPVTAFPALMGISLAFVAVNTAMLSTLQSETPPRLRGRVLSLYSLLMSGAAPFGTLLYAGLSRVVPLFDAIGAGALVVGATLLLAATRPALRQLH